MKENLTMRRTQLRTSDSWDSIPWKKRNPPGTSSVVSVEETVAVSEWGSEEGSVVVSVEESAAVSECGSDRPMADEKGVDLGPALG